MPSVFPRPLRRLLLHLLLLLGLWAGELTLAVSGAGAAEILSIRSGTQLQVGDQNRSYGVKLACLAVNEAQSQEAQGWLQRHGPRGTRVNLRPLAEQDGLLVARVSVLKSGLDLGQGMVAAGLASPLPCSPESPEG